MEVVRPLKLDDLNVSCLNEEERKRLNQVLARNSQICSHENSRLIKMDREIRTEVNKFSRDKQVMPTEKCLVCRKDLGEFKGCEKCKKNICKKCCIEFGSSAIELCKVCYKEMLLEAKTARWFYSGQHDKDVDDGSSDVMRPTIQAAQHSQAPSNAPTGKNNLTDMVATLLRLDATLTKLAPRAASQDSRRSGSTSNTAASKDIIKASPSATSAAKPCDKNNQKVIDEFVAKMVQLNTVLSVKVTDKRKARAH